jgi:hypothetical protein
VQHSRLSVLRARSLAINAAVASIARASHWLPLGDYSGPVASIIGIGISDASENQPGVHVPRNYHPRRSPSVMKCPTLVGAASIADPPRKWGPLAWAHVLASRCAVHLFETRLEGDILRKSIAAILAGLLSCSSVVAAEPALLLPSAVGVPERTPAQRPLDLETLREEIRIASRDGSLQTAAQQSPPENKSWMKRHPVWSGLIIGAGAGAAVGAVSCSGGCYLIGAGGAAVVGSWYGAGAGALIGWGVGRAK